MGEGLGALGKRVGLPREDLFQEFLDGLLAAEELAQMVQEAPTSRPPRRRSVLM